MKKHLKTIAFSSLALLFLIPLVSLANNKIVLPAKGEKMKTQENRSVCSNKEACRQANQSKHQEMISILEQNDYQAWLDFVADKDCPMKAQVSEENFSDFVKAHQDRLIEREARQQFRGVRAR